VHDVAVGENESIGGEDESGTTPGTAPAVVLDFDADDGGSGALRDAAYRSGIRVQ